MENKREKMQGVKQFMYQKVPKPVLAEFLSHHRKSFVPFLKERDYMGRLYETRNEGHELRNKLMSSLKKKRVHINGVYSRTIVYHGSAKTLLNKNSGLPPFKSP